MSPTLQHLRLPFLCVYLLYFISFILLVGFFVLNMFVGVVVENFHRCREEQEKEERVRRAAKRALQMEKKRRSELELIFRKRWKKRGGTNKCWVFVF